jgi:general stress protein YciG
VTAEKQVQDAAKLLGSRGGKKSRAYVSKERAHEIAVKAGKASGESRRKKHE